MPSRPSMKVGRRLVVRSKEEVLDVVSGFILALGPLGLVGKRSGGYIRVVETNYVRLTPVRLEQNPPSVQGALEDCKKN